MMGTFDEVEVAGLRYAYSIVVDMANGILTVDADVERKLANILVTTYRREMRSISMAPVIAPEELANVSLERFKALIAYEHK